MLHELRLGEKSSPSIRIERELEKLWSSKNEEELISIILM
jgi:hypothetical protein